jgi:DNA mismatch repair protein MutS2
VWSLRDEHGDTRVLLDDGVVTLRVQKRRAGERFRVVLRDAEVEVRGTRFEDAMGELERYLDLAFRSGTLLEATIVHGLGTGALREGTRKLLGRLPYVKSFRDGGIGHGGSGATIVEFDRD